MTLGFSKTALIPLQVEQFIESIFPSQKPPADIKSPASVEEAEKAKKQAYEDKWDIIYMTAAVIITVLIITFCMVYCTRLPYKMFSNSILDFRCLPGRCSLRPRLLRNQAPNQGIDGMGRTQGS
jgi:hypothetical protein